MSLRFAQSSRRLKIRALEEVKEIKTQVQNLGTILHHLPVKVAHLRPRIKVVREIEVQNHQEAHHLKTLDARKIVHPNPDSLLRHHLHKIRVAREIVLPSLDSHLRLRKTQVGHATDRQIHLEAHHHKTVD